MKICHISDLHLNHQYDKLRTIGVYKFLKYLSKKYDHIVITGDISDNSDEEDFIIFREILKKLNLLNGEKVSIVIGNHDIFGGIFKAEDILNFPQRCRETDYESKVSSFNNHFKELFSNCVYQSEKNLYPFAKLINDSLLIGVNSIAPYSSFRNPFASNGEIADDQLVELEKILSEYSKYCKSKIVLVHHHFNKMKYMTESLTERLWMNIEKQTMKLREKKKILKLLRLHDVNVILHGHFHQMQAYNRKSINVVNAGASLKNIKNQEYRYNELKFRNGSIEIVTGAKIIERKSKPLLQLIHSKNELSTHLITA